MKRILFVFMLLSSMSLVGCNSQQGPPIRTSVSQVTDLPGGAQRVAVVDEYHNLTGHNQSVMSVYLKKPNGEICLFDHGYADAGLIKAGITAASNGAIGQAVRRPSTINAANSGATVDVESLSEAQSAASSFIGEP